MASWMVTETRVSDCRCTTSPNAACRASSAGSTTAFQPEGSACSERTPRSTAAPESRSAAAKEAPSLSSMSSRYLEEPLTSTPSSASRSEPASVAVPGSAWMMSACGLSVGTGCSESMAEAGSWIERVSGSEIE